MQLEWNLTHALGLSAAALILALGAFVLAARPRTNVARAFFAFALFDGLSSGLFELRDMSISVDDQIYFQSTYYYHYIASIAMLLGFGLVFPRPLVAPRWRVLLVAGLGALTLALLLVFAMDHSAFWSVQVRGGRAFFPRAHGGSIVNTIFAATVVFVVLKLTRDLLSDAGEGHRRQAAFVLAGLIVGYGSIPAIIVARAIATSRGLFVSDPLTRLFIWSYVAASIAVVYAGWRVARSRTDLPRERRFVLAAVAVVVSLAALALVAPAAMPILQIIGLVIYPILLGYAILRYAVFDIHAHVRRAVIFSAGALVAAAVFIVAENFLQDLIEARLAAVAPFGWAAGVLAALVAAAVAVPVARLARRVAPGLLPDAPVDAIHRRRLDIYRYSVEGAVADGEIDRVEVGALARLRESLAISPAEHAAIMAAVRGRVVA